MTRVVGWVCNLAGELELIDPEFVPSSGLAARVGEQARRFLEVANAHARGVVRHVDASREDADLRQAWLPTPRVGEVTGGAAPIDVLRRVNHRRFAAELGLGLPDARYCDTVEDVEVVLAARPFPRAGYLMKRPFGFSGRSRKRVATETLTSSDRTWIEASMTDEYGGGLLVEPFVSIEAEFSLHGFLPRGEDACVFGDPVRQFVDEAGGWSDARLAGDDLESGEARSLRDAGERAARALRQAGYFGPFSVDAYRYGDSFCALGELNARYSMAFFVGFSSRLDAWLEAITSA